MENNENQAPVQDQTNVENQETVVETKTENAQGPNLEEVQSKYSQLKGDYDVIKSQYEADKIRFEEERYADPLVKRIDEMVREGADRKQIAKFASLQTLELDKMSSEDLIKQKLSLEKPSFSAKEIDSLFKRDFKPLDEEAEDDEKEMREITLKEKALEARTYLEDQLATASDSKAIEAKAKRESEHRAMTTRYETVASSLMKQVDKLPFNLETDKFKYSFDFPIQRNEEIDKNIVQSVVSEAMKHGVSLNDTESIKEMMQLSYEMVYHREMKEAMVRDMDAEFQRRSVIANSNPSSLPSGSGAPKNAPPPPKPKKGPVTIKGSTYY